MSLTRSAVPKMPSQETLKLGGPLLKDRQSRVFDGKARSIRRTAITYGAYDVLRQMLKNDLGQEFPIIRPKKTRKIDPHSYYIGICTPAVFGIEVIGLTLRQLQKKGKLLNVRVLYFLPFEGHIYLSAEHVYVARGCQITRNGEIQPIEFDKPVPIDQPIFESYKSIGENHQNDEIYELTRNKNEAYWFCKEEGFPATDVQFFYVSGEGLAEGIKQIRDCGKHSVVVKPLDDSGGRGVKMFDPACDRQAVAYARKLIDSCEAIVMERRINSFPICRDGTRMDWNVRFMIPFDCDRQPIVNSVMTYVRISTFGEHPVSASKNASVEPLKDVIAALPLSSARKAALYEELKSLMERLGERLIERLGGFGIHEMPTLIGVDLILDEDLRWRVVELNSGNVGDIPTVLEHNGFKTAILAPILQGLIRSKGEVKERCELVEPTMENLRTYYWGDLGSILKEFDPIEARRAFAVLSSRQVTQS